MILKEHVGNDKLTLSIVDDDLLGKKFEEKNHILDLTSEYYKGEPRTEEQIIKMMKRAYMTFGVGEKTIAFFQRQGLISEGNIVRIQNIPFANILLLENDD
jgi:hypothetical protein